MAETWFAWLCCADVEECDSKEDALDEMYWRYDADNACQVQEVEGPDGQTITDEEFRAYRDARDEEARVRAVAYEKRQNKPIGMIKLKPPWDIKGWSRTQDYWGWCRAESPKTEEQKDQLMARYTELLGEDRVVFIPAEESNG